MRISVVMATYNGARFVREQVESILRGSLAPDELVVADDGSSDATLEIVRSVFASTAPAGTTLVVLEGSAPLGVTANFERGLLASGGELIALSDQDDVWHSDRLAAAVEAFRVDDALELQHADARLVDEAGAPLGASLTQALSVRAGERAALAAGRPFGTYIRRNLATGATIMLRRRLVDRAVPFPPTWVHDEWLAIIAAATGAVQFLDRELIDYRQHGSNQIGVQVPTLRYRVRKMLEPREDRYSLLAARAAVLSQRLAELDAPAEFRILADDKARFEALRASLPAVRLARLPAVVREALKGSYGRLSSQGALDVVRNLLQPD
ncbi:glycosyltransferase family 2 protein [soil metagenome]